jgi:hypothetical protein
MDDRFSGLIVTAAIAVALSAAVSMSITRTSAQALAGSGVTMRAAPLKTAWGEPDLQGIWTDEFDTPLQRSAKYANQEFFTEVQRAELDQVRSGILNRRATDRTGPMTLSYEVTIEDPTVWTRPWTVKQEFSRQSDDENRLYPEPRCIEGNQGLPGLLHGRRVEDLAFAEGRGPDPATKDNTADFRSTATLEDPLQ